MAYGTAIVSVPIRREIGTLPRPPSWMREDRANSTDYFVIKSIDIVEERSTFLSDLSAVIRAADQREVLVFVHGYNTSFATAVLRTAQLAADLELSGAPVLYSWPSKGTVLSYLMDRNEAIAPYVWDLKNLIRDVASQTGASKVHLLAHSLGGEFLLRALEELTVEPGNGRARPFAETIFAAPDIDAFDFAERVPRVQGLSRRTTLYSSNTDMALRWSEWVNGTARAGGVLFGGGVECVETRGVWAEAFGHSDYAMSAIDDLRGIVWLSLHPSHRRTLQERTSATGRYWVCDPDVLTAAELSSARQALVWARRVGTKDAIDVLSQIVRTPATNADQLSLHKTYSEILGELKLLVA